MASPLGLTTFSNIKYTSDDGDTSSANFSGRYNSLFNKSKFYYRPNIATTKQDSTTNDSNQKDVAKGTKTHQPDNSTDDLYDISTNSIINYTQQKDSEKKFSLPALKLNGTDFAYLRDLGVYPNNRLIIGRRFPSPVENDLTAVGMEAISTIVSWIPDTAESFFSFETSEEWSNSGAVDDPLGELTDIFNKVFAKGTGIDVKGQGKGILGGVAKMFPIGGVGEALETEVTNYLLGKESAEGTNFSFDNLPQGNPNFMGESSFRKMNSIRSSISIPVKVVYEMKFINGINPTIAYMDILQNLLRFSSSQSVFYISQAGGEKINEFFNHYKKGEWLKAISIIVDSIIHAVGKTINKFGDVILALKDTLTDAVTGGNSTDGSDADSDADSEGGDGTDTSFLDSLKELTGFIGSSSLARYRIKFAKIIPASTGASSGPWHVTIGNPKNPFFSSGDMIVDGGKITMGNTLGFNDIPTRIEFDYTIKSARNLGIQEIFDKFNVGAGRQYERTAIQFKTDFNQGSVNNTNTDDNTTNPATGASA